MVNRGDELKVRVVELNKERGRIGLRLADDPAIEGKTAEELSSIGTGNGASGGGRAAGTATAAVAAAAAVTVTAAAEAATATDAGLRLDDAHAHRARLGHPGRH